MTLVFQMGSPATEPGSDDAERPVHPVTILDFWMGRYLITQEQWKQVATWPKINIDLKWDPSSFKGVKRPVEGISWHEAVEFCARLSQRLGQEYRLPSEAEWEYACRAGTNTAFHFGETITPDLANYDGKFTYGQGPKGVYRKQTTEVGYFKVANVFGLYDMHGNVWEWCLDHWHDNYNSAPTDGNAWISTKNVVYRLLRGGSWLYSLGGCRSAYRNYSYRDESSYDIGFRIVARIQA